MDEFVKNALTYAYQNTFVTALIAIQAITGASIVWLVQIIVKLTSRMNTLKSSALGMSRANENLMKRIRDYEKVMALESSSIEALKGRCCATPV